MPRVCTVFASLQQLDLGGLALLNDVARPDASLDFADVGFFEEYEAEARLADAAADGLWELVVA